MWWEHFFHLEGVAAALAIISCALMAIQWLLARRDEARASRGFVRDMATNHLPHLYNRLGRIDQKLGLPYEQAPPIRFEEPAP